MTPAYSTEDDRPISARMFCCLRCLLSHPPRVITALPGCVHAGTGAMDVVCSPFLFASPTIYIQHTIMFDIHTTVLGHGVRLARRGLDMTSQNQPGGGQVASVEVPPAIIAIFATVAVLFVLGLSSVRYTLHGVIATMAMVEEPSTAFLVSEKRTFAEKEDVTEPLLHADVETVAVTSEPITSSIRTSMHHILEAGGWTGRWRGLGVFILWGIGNTVLRKVWMTLLTGEEACFVDLGLPAAHVLSSLIAGVSMMKLHMFWTRKVLTVPGTKTFYDQTPRKTFKALFLPTVANTLAWEATIGLPITLAYALGVVGTSADGMHAFIGSQDGQAHCHMVVKMVLIGLMGIGTFFGVFIPSHVALIRIEASLITEDAQTIVPFDRSFGGRVVSESDGGSGKLSYMQAWSSFSSAQRVRLLRLFGKIFAVEVALHAVFGFFAASLALAILRPDVFARVGRTHV